MKMNYFICLFLIMWMSLYFSNFYILWIFMELNLMLFITMIVNENFNKNSMFYFLISSISSLMILYSFINLNYLNNNFYLNNFFNTKNILNNMFIISIWMKLGNFPFHHWMNLFLKNMNFMNIFIYSTFLKLTPMLIFFYYNKMNLILFMSLLIMMIIISFMMFLQNSIKLLFSYSSIMHMSMMLILIYLNIEMWMIYFLMYLLMSMSLMMFMDNFYINNKYNFLYNNIINKKFIYLLYFMIFSYSQMPPISTFMMKINFSNILTNFNNNLFSLLIIFILCSLISTFNYLNYFNIIFFNNSNMKLTFMLMKYKFSNLNSLFLIKITLMILILSMFFLPLLY